MIDRHPSVQLRASQILLPITASMCAGAILLGCADIVEPPPPPPPVFPEGADPWCAPATLDAHAFTAPQSDSKIGQSLAHGDFDSDGVPDLAIGGPLATTGGHSGAGVVMLCWGLDDTPTDGFDVAEDCDLIESPGGAEDDEMFGAALATWTHPSNEREWLVVGVPGVLTPAETTGAVFGLLFGEDGGSYPREHVDDWKLTSRVSAPPGDTVRQFGSAVVVGDFGMPNGWPDIAVSSPSADARLPDASSPPQEIDYVDIGIVEVFFGDSPNFFPAPPFDVSAGGQVVYVPEAADRQDDMGFGASMAAGAFLGDSDTDLAIGAPGADSATGLVTVGQDVAQVTPSTNTVAVDLTVSQGDAAPDDDGDFGFDLTTGISGDYPPEAGDQYGFALATLHPPSVTSLYLEHWPIAEAGGAADLLIVGAPGEDIGITNPISDVGTACLLDLSGASAPSGQWCLDVFDGAGLGSRQPGLKFGSAVAGGYLLPSPSGFDKAYVGADIVAGAPGFIDGYQVGAVTVSSLTRPPGGGALQLASLPTVIRGDDATDSSGQDLRFGSAVHLYDLTGGGQADLVATAPLLGGTDEGGFAWTIPKLSSAPQTGPGFGVGYYEWTWDESYVGWEDDTMNLLLLDLQGQTDFIGASLWSQTNHPFVGSSGPFCRELPINMLNVLPSWWDILPAGGFGEGGPDPYACTGSDGSWAPHELTEEQACEDEPDPGFVGVGEPWPRQIFSLTPHSTCGDSLTTMLYPVFYSAPRASPLDLDLDFTEFLTEAFDDAVVEVTVNHAMFRLRLTPGSGTPPSTVDVTFLAEIDTNPPFALEINNAVLPGLGDDDDSASEELTYTFEHTGDFSCEH